MSKKRSRRPFTPAQLAAQARFAATFGGKKAKKSGKKKSKKAKAAKKRAAKKAARKNPKAHKQTHRKAKRRNPGKKHSMHRRRRNKGAPPKKTAAKKTAAKRTAAKKPAAKKGSRARRSADKVLAAASEAMSPSKPKRTRKPKSPAEKARAKALAKIRKQNADRIKKVRDALKKTRAELKSMPKLSRPKKGQKRGKIGAKRRILKTQKAALNLTRSALIGSMSADDRRIMQASGLMRANPGFAGIFADFVQLLPQVGAHAVALAGVAVAGQKIGDMIAQKTPASMPGRAFIAQHAVTIGSVAAAVAAYEAMKHASPKTRPFAGAVLMGGLAAAFVHAAARASWGSKIGLPLSSAAVLPASAAAAPAAPQAGFIDVGGRPLAVDGMGEYMALSGNTLTGSSLGEYMALSGSTLTGSSLGEYMALSGSTLTGSTLGEIGQMSEGRQGARALNAPGDIPVEDFLEDHDEEDEGSLSGSIFDD